MGTFFQYRKFPIPLGPSVNPNRIGYVILIVWMRPFSVKYIIGGNVDYPGTHFLGGTGYEAGAGNVQVGALFRVIFRPVYRRIGGAVNYPIKGISCGDLSANKIPHCRRIGNINFPVGSNKGQTAFVKRKKDFGPQHAFAAGKPDQVANPGSFLSFSDRI
jgi:hypothetical protein